ncbi:MAG: molybdenum ABC transporter ATP-binding protein [Gammaproteobacteria bacterium]|nr:molybdenum ABC transporter ATP-binding protein [Gammaproteobacteria bacterium]MCP4089971.1 molybdenum ABC transporter ATP-binding protein [Gammaproteobacteria bacterium]MCP4276302.1 molybdenum ABC transporter ATP-binding protein [Gammaproteobacteria bacterium]MCP4831297.1 molybdenum ABC transporter ATP-binding protein [Gammaproteobacteria bacterium]MCP4928780.1 molybdenum ABC transporter ATP-binding protein [Gammaproteobacteria bacterium]
MNTGLSAQLRLINNGFSLDATLNTPDNGITVLFGASGTGKTTLLRAIAGLEKSTGSLSVGGEIWQDEHTCLPAHKRACGYVFQEANLFTHMNVRSNLQYGYTRSEHAEYCINFEHATELLTLNKLLDRPSTQLSGGERKRVAIAQALLSGPKLLLLDEPLASLDARHKSELMPFLERLHSELDIPIIYVSHAPDEVAQLADYLALMDGGRILATGAMNEILTRFDLPVAHDADAGAVLSVTPGDHDTQYNLTTLNFSGGSLLVPGRIDTDCENMRVRIMARDVSLTLQRQTNTSILNIVSTTVIELSNDGAAQTLVKLDAGGTALLARITCKSAAAMNITTGMKLYAQIKSVALLNG